MIFGKEKALAREIIKIGAKLYNLRLVAGSSGNLSGRLGNNNILITTTGAHLAGLTQEQIAKVNLTVDTKKENLTTEFPLHKLIYENFPNKLIIHCHPALTNAYFAIYSDLKVLTFESKVHLGNIPVVEQDTPAVTKPELVIEALKLNKLVVLKNHGVVAIADSFKEALSLIETLEEAVRIASVARLFKKDLLDDLDKELKEDLAGGQAFAMFSKDHIQAIVGLVNKDEFFLTKGRELDLTLQLAIRLERGGEVYKFTFEKGRIAKLESDANAPFVISAPADVWELVFLGKLEPFAATMQGRMKLKGDLGRLSRWYVPFSRLFELFKQVKIK